MAEVWEWRGYSIAAGDWTLVISGTGNRIGFCGATFGSSVGVNEWQDTTWRTNNDMTANYGQMNNTKYIGVNLVNINSSGTDTTLTSGSVSINQVTLRISFQEDTQATQTSMTRFYAYDGVTPVNPPSGVSTVGFEVDVLLEEGILVR